jgi:hypothetical protein
LLPYLQIDKTLPELQRTLLVEMEPIKVSVFLELELELMIKIVLKLA